MAIARKSRDWSRDKQRFWQTFIRSVEAEPRNSTTIRGASGLLHPVVAMGVDDSRRRVVLISGEPEARSAAMAHADIQATMPSVKVLMARSVVVNLAYPARVLTEILGKVSLSLEDIEVFFRDQGEKEIKQIKQLIQQFFDNSSTIQEYASVNAVGFWQEIVGQLSLIQIEHPQCGVSTKIENPKQEVRPPK